MGRGRDRVLGVAEIPGAVAFRWYLTPQGKLARSGTLLAEKMPKKSRFTDTMWQ